MVMGGVTASRSLPAQHEPSLNALRALLRAHRTNTLYVFWAAWRQESKKAVLDHWVKDPQLKARRVQACGMAVKLPRRRQPAGFLRRACYSRVVVGGGGRLGW